MGLLAPVVIATVSGCATTFTLIGQGVEPKLSVAATPTGLARVDMTDGCSDPTMSAAIQHAWVGNALIAGNFVAAGLVFQNHVAAAATVALASWGLDWVDGRVAAWLTRTPGTLVAEREDGTQIPIKTGVAVLRREGPGRWTGTLPNPGAKLAVVKMLGAGKVVVAEARMPGRRVEAPVPSPVPSPGPRREAPRLVAAVQFDSATNDNMLRAGRGGEIAITIANEGKGAARDVRLHLQTESTVEGLRVPPKWEVGALSPGERRTVKASLKPGNDLQSGRVALWARVEDADGYDATPIRLVFETRAYEKVRLAVDPQVAVENFAGDSVVKRGEQLEVKVRVDNVCGVESQDTQAELLIGDSKILAVNPPIQSLGTIPAGSSRVASFSILINNAYTGPAKLPLRVRLSEAKGEGDKDTPILVMLDEATPRLAEVIVEARGLRASGDEEELELLTDVDKPIPDPQPEDPDAYGLVIGIERYQSNLPPVPYVRRDAQSVRKYFTQALGVPPHHMILLQDEQATKTSIELTIRKLMSMVQQGSSRVYVYVAGHGTAGVNEAAGAYLVPFDGAPAFPAESCLPLAGLYESLGKLRADRVTVVQDTCFSGMASRADTPATLVAGARPLVVAPREASLPKGLVVLAATHASGMSNAYPAKRHGLYTYYLLEALRKPSARRQPLEELLRDVRAAVARQAAMLGKEQVPDCQGDGELLKRGLLP
jgi:hypothetical protein